MILNALGRSARGEGSADDFCQGVGQRQSGNCSIGCTFKSHVFNFNNRMRTRAPGTHYVGDLGVSVERPRGRCEQTTRGRLAQTVRARSSPLYVYIYIIQYHKTYNLRYYMI